MIYLNDDIAGFDFDGALPLLSEQRREQARRAQPHHQGPLIESRAGKQAGPRLGPARRGLYAPGQGLFPRLTDGLYGDGKMLLSRGMTNGAKPRIPRINNPCELIILTLEPVVPSHA